jgi:translation initiation factor 1 (eIF-1/SUI1)
MSVEEVEKKKKAESEALKKEAKEDAKASRIKEKSKTNKVTVKTVERTKRKRITTIHGLDLFGPFLPLFPTCLKHS